MSRNRQLLHIHIKLEFFLTGLLSEKLPESVPECKSAFNQSGIQSKLSGGLQQSRVQARDYEIYCVSFFLFLSK